MAYEILRSVHEDLRMIISNQKIRIVTCSSKSQVTTVIECNLRYVTHKEITIFIMHKSMFVAILKVVRQLRNVKVQSRDIT